MIKYAVTGNIASGKSTVEKILHCEGFQVLDTDKTAHEILSSNQEIKKIFQDYDVFENNEISREKLGKLVFTDKKLLKKLENIIHPLVKEKILEFYNKNSDKEKIFVSIPLLFESNMENLFDKIIFVYTDDEIRLKRLIERNNYTPEYAQIRLNSQMPQQEKVNKSDIVIYNNSTFEELKAQVLKLIV